MARAGDVAPSVYALLAEYEHAPRIAPPKGADRVRFRRCRGRDWVSPTVTFDSRRKRTTHWLISAAGQVALDQHRAQQRAQGSAAA